MKTNMNWIKDLLLLVFSFFICYIILILGDWSLSKFIKLNTNNLSSFNEVIEIEKSRKIKDITLKEIAISEGYSLFLFPTYIDSNNILSRHLVREGFSMLAGLPNKKTVLCNEGYGMIRYKSDRFGFRNEDVNWNKDIDDLFIGDSFVVGSCVNNKNTLSYVYGKHNNRNSLNLGVRGNNPLHYEVTANIFIPQFTPKNIYIVFYANDYGKFSSHLNKIYIKQKKKYFSDDGLSLFNKEQVIKLGNNILSKQYEKQNNFKIIIYNKILPFIEYRMKLPVIFSLISDYSLLGSSKDTIVNTKKLCEKFDCKLNIVYIPNSKYWRPSSVSDIYADQLKSFVEDNDLFFIDTRKILDRDKGSKDYAIEGSHLSPKGYEKVALFISD